MPFHVIEPVLAVTVPKPFPDLTTVRVRVSPELNVAVTSFVEDIATVQVLPFVESHPVQPANEPEEAAAVS